MLLTAESIPAVPGVTTAPRPFSNAASSTAPPPVVTKTMLVRDGDALVKALTNQVKESAAIEGPVAITCIRAAMTLVQQRPQFMGRIMPTLITLARQRAKKEDGDGAGVSGGGGGGGGGEGNATTAALKEALMVAYESTHPMAQAWKKKIADALASVGIQVAHLMVDEEGEEEGAGMEVDVGTDAVGMKNRKRKDREGEGGEEGAGEDELVGNGGHSSKRMATSGAGTGAGVALGGVVDGGFTALRQLDSTFRSLITSQDAGGIATTLAALSPESLADLVLLYLPNLPANKGLLPPDHFPHASWLDELYNHLHGAGTGGGFSAPQDPRLAVVAATAPGPVPSQLPTGIIKTQTGHPAPMIKPEKLEIPRDIFAVKHLTESEVAAQRRNAVLRIVKTTQTSVPHVRAALVARLATCTPDADNITSAILDYVLDDFQNRGGLDFALTWLMMLFTEAVGTSGAAATDPSELIEGSRYEDVLLSFLEGLRAKMPPNDRTMIVLMNEVPALPGPRIRDFLSSLCSGGVGSSQEEQEQGEWATVGLIAARDIAMGRPPCRQVALGVALDAAVSANDDVRSKAVRLVANRLFPEATMMEGIEKFAKGKLDDMLSLERGGSGGGSAGKGAAPEQKEEEEEEKEEEKGATTTTPTPATMTTATEAQSYQHLCSLYCALCTKKHSLLRGLFEAFAAAGPQGKAALLENASGLAKTLGQSAPALLVVIQDPPPGSLDLVLAMLHVLTNTGEKPSSLLVGACLQLFNATKDARVVAPVLSGFDKAMITRMLPSVLASLPGEVLKQVITRLTTSSTATFSPPEFLALLHTLDPAVMKPAMAAIHVCISSPELFPPEALAGAINQLLSRGQLPPLFMRTVIQTLAAAPKLRPFVVGVLGQLAAKQIWNDATQWRGWVMAAQQTMPDSCSTVLQLPATVMEVAVNGMSVDAKRALVGFVNSPQCKVAMSKETRAVVQRVAGEVGQ